MKIDPFDPVELINNDLLPDIPALIAWAERACIPLIVLQQAQYSAAICGRLYDVMSCVRSKAIDDLLPPQHDRNAWLSLYRKHNLVTQAMGKIFDEPMNIRETMQDARSFDKQYKAGEIKLYETEDEAWEWLKEFRENAYMEAKCHFRDLEKVIRDQDEDDDLDRFDELFSKDTAFLFFCRVALPLAFQFKLHPTVAYWRARHHDVAAIEALLRVDDLAIHLDCVQKWLMDSPRAQVRRDRLEDATRWVQQGLDHGQFSLKRIKFNIGRYISALAQDIRQALCPITFQMKPTKLNSNQIRKLFNAVRLDRSHRKRGLVDEDLGDLQTKTIGKRIKEHRREWQRYLRMEGMPKLVTSFVP